MIDDDAPTMVDRSPPSAVRACLARAGSPALPPTPLPESIGRYRVIDRLGHGGMGEVFLVELDGPRSFRKRLAIKRLRAPFADDPAAVDRFAREAVIAARLGHPTVCQVYELGEDDDGYFIVMEYLEGVTLARVLAGLDGGRLRLSIPVVLRVVGELCAGLAAAHALRGDDGAPLGLVHRDVSPANVVITAAGQVKLLDFGVAKTDGFITQAGVLRGKYGYMSPEQITGQPVDRRSDVFALGVILFEGLVGRRLFARTTLAATTRAILDEPIPSLRTLRSDVSPALADVVRRALARSRDERLPTASALGDGLAAATAPLAPASAARLAAVVARVLAAADDRPLAATADVESTQTMTGLPPPPAC